MLVDEYNKNVPTYNNMINIEKEKIDTYNELVNKYNTLAKNAYSRWWLLPFPIPGSHSPHINQHFNREIGNKINYFLLLIEKINLDLKLFKNQKSMIVQNMDLLDFRF